MLSTVLCGFVVRTLTLLRFASAVLGGLTRRSAWLGAAAGAFSLSSGLPAVAASGSRPELLAGPALPRGPRARLRCSRTYCLILIAQPELLQNLTPTVNEDLKNRVTYSVLLKKLAPDSIADFVRAKATLAHSTFSDDALSLIVPSSEGGLRKARNLCLAALLEAVRDRTKTVELKQVNRVLLQPHWRKEVDLPH